MKLDKLGEEDRRQDQKHREALYTALILDSNGGSRVVAVLVIARPLHTARVHRNVSAVDDNVAVAEGVLAAFHLAGVLHYTSGYRNDHDWLTRWIVSSG